MAKDNSPKAPRRFPSKADIVAFIRESPNKVGKREIARAFSLHGNDRIALKAILKEIKDEGLIDQDGKGAAPGKLPPVLVVEVSGLDEDGEVLARPADWTRNSAPPTIYLAPDSHSRGALARGDRVLVRTRRVADGVFEAHIIRRLESSPKRMLGVYEVGSQGGRLRPTEKRTRKEFSISREHAGGAEPGELVLAEPLPQRRGARLGLHPVKVVERLGSVGEPSGLSLIAIHEHDLPVEFPAAALEQAAAAGPAELGKRIDLRGLPLVTIDGADARDFDDAVFAEPDTKVAGGWHILVAIADVAHYVEPGSALDRAAYERGNSAYFPDRVVPMLPEALSNGWCSLVPDEERPCFAAEMWIDAGGQLTRWHFQRGLMRSAARLTYEEVQAARDGQPAAKLKPLIETVIAPLYGAFAALLAARQVRGTLDLEMPERQILLGEDGRVATIEARTRLDSHRLIEEFMITANVAAAKELERHRLPCMYRIHDRPDTEKLAALSEILASFGLKLSRGQVVRPKTLTNLLHKVAGRPEAIMVNELILRSQSQAEYNPHNIGHFGLALTHYAHFTSPIRRYADLLVHRSLAAAVVPNADRPMLRDEAWFEEAGRHISRTERRAAAAERDAVDRYTAAFLQGRIGEWFQGRVNGVTRFGLFVTLDESGADGLVPMSELPDDYYDHDADRHCLIGRRWGRRFDLGQQVTVQLREAEPLTGGVILRLHEDKEDQAASRNPPQAKSGPPRGHSAGRGKARSAKGRRPRR